MKIINPILLAGGSGTRLWPLSRKTYPKQFVNFNSEKTLFQQAALRLSAWSGGKSSGDSFVGCISGVGGWHGQ